MLACMKKLLVLGGPTASGKTALAIALAKELGTVILSADSRQCYREMTIGTAVPTKEELAQVPHYFIQTHSIHDTVNAGTFETYAMQVLEQAFQTHDVVVCTGGTGLYIQALLNGFDPMPETPEAVKTKAQHDCETHGLRWLQEQVAHFDPVLFKRIDQQNTARLLRAYSFYLAHQKPLSSFQHQSKKVRPFESALFCLMPEKEILHQRIHLRVYKMMQAGLWQEAERLYPYRHLNALQTVGYSELFDVMDGNISLTEAIEQIKTHTRQYAKRQITWFKHQTNAQFLPPEVALHDILISFNK
ncbi:MAG: tRNA (adenosine(37)-N6)-dimethylallyltransferase MiaA [Chitinophagaceae bacterium]|nr:tRNA (adenosine(37)-N6)-dimethylallyltransferase MiaA [Chitinophagaceae bacterium]